MIKRLTLIVSLALVLGISPFFTVSAEKSPEGELVFLRTSLYPERFTADDDAAGGGNLLVATNERLLRQNLEGEDPGYYPMLAEKWEVSKDGLTYDFYLRKGIQWHEGYGEFTAEDVKFSFEFIGRKDSQHLEGYKFATGKGGNVTSLEVVDPYHFRMKLKKPDSFALTSFAFVENPMYCKKYYEKVGAKKAERHPIGTGSWRFVEHVEGEYIKWEAVENHWRKTPEFKYLVWKAIPKVETQIAMLRTGDGDVCKIPPEKVKEAKAAGLTIKGIPNYGYLKVILGGQLPPNWKGYDPTVPWVDHQDEPADSEWNQRALKVRKALNIAVDKQTILDVIFKGYGDQTPLHGWALDSVFSRSEWKPYPYDPEKAKALLAEAGYAKGFKKPITMYITESPVEPLLKNVMLAVADYWEAVGIKIDRRPVEPSISSKEFTGHADLTPWKVGGGSYQNLYDVGLVYTWFLDSHISWYNAIKNPTLEKHMQKITRAVSWDEKVELTKQLGDTFIKNYYDVCIGVIDRIVAMSSKVGELRYALGSDDPFVFEYVARSKK